MFGSVTSRPALSEPGKYYGWPANYGIWKAADNTLRTGAFVGRFNARDKRGFHPYLPPVLGERRVIQIASTDNGETWQPEGPPGVAPCGPFCLWRGNLRADCIIGRTIGSRPPELNRQKLDFGNPNTVLLFSRTSWTAAPRSWFYFSTDGGESWSMPMRLPLQHRAGFAMRTDYSANDDGTALVCVTAMKPDGHEGETWVAKTDGVEWRVVARLDCGRDARYAIMAAIENVGWQGKQAAGMIWDRLVAVRVSIDTRQNFIRVFRLNSNNGRHELASEFDTGLAGNPPALVRTSSGRNLLFWWRRALRNTDEQSQLFGVELDNHGLAMGPASVIRSSIPGAYDLGYCRAIEAADSTIALIYYFDSGKPQRSIECTRLALS